MELKLIVVLRLCYWIDLLIEPYGIEIIVYKYPVWPPIASMVMVVLPSASAQTTPAPRT